MEEFNDQKIQRVRQIGFKVIPEDGPDANQCVREGDSKKKRRKIRKGEFENSNSNTNVNGKQIMLTPLKQHHETNYLFERAYPAVIFNDVCFSIDKSQQQANFYYECLYRVKSCIRRKPESEQKVDILKSINLTVPCGSIFGLLGPSSCGKTTLLRCLVGLLRPNSGSIRLFSHSLEKKKATSGNGDEKKQMRGLRSSNCKVPGPNVGYMPQDLGLYDDFTIRQILTTFGQFMRMPLKLIESRIEFMAQFLDLPEVDREICSLSGGQKRRVSFAIACLHMPPLIILDEPTVGVDPLLRQNIWKYLHRLANEENKTIIITTHYIEEAAQADQVALMRAGEILVQDAPKRIMEAHGCTTLEEAFLKICNNVQTKKEQLQEQQQFKLYPQPKFNHQVGASENGSVVGQMTVAPNLFVKQRQLNQRPPKFLNVTNLNEIVTKSVLTREGQLAKSAELDSGPLYKSSPEAQDSNFETTNSLRSEWKQQQQYWRKGPINRVSASPSAIPDDNGEKNEKYCINNKEHCDNVVRVLDGPRPLSKVIDCSSPIPESLDQHKSFQQKMNGALLLAWALVHKNYRRNMNSLPLLAFQFVLPIVQMISFSLCVGGRPVNIGLGIVNHDHPMLRSDLLMAAASLSSLASPLSNNSSIVDANLNNYNDTGSSNLDYDSGDGLLSLKYLSFVDQRMISLRPYGNLKDALRDVRQAKIWAAMEIGENFTTALLQRFDVESFYQLDLETMHQSVIKLYPDRSNKVLDMICHRSLVQSYRKFASEQFEQFRRLPIEVKEPIFEIKPNLISNSIDGYTESIAAGLLASLTYIMAAGLTTFIMVVERGAGILERTYTSGISPVGYLLAHAVFRSLVMMVQIAVVLFLTFYILKQPLLGSIWLAYLMLMTLNLTGISYGLLISSIVTDQNGAALTIVSSLVVKITMSGILWPYEAIPRWLRAICYIQPLTMPVQALKAITLKGSGLEDRAVYLGFLVSLTWLTLFLTIAAKRFKFYQH